MVRAGLARLAAGRRALMLHEAHVEGGGGDVADGATFSRELSALREAKAATGIKDCVVVTWDTEADLGDGIRAVPVWQWCLSA